MRIPYSNRTIFWAGALAAALLLLSIDYRSKPRVLAVSEVPVAFWAWRTRAPGSAEVQNAFAATNARTLFLRAGQLDVVNGTIQRIRPVSGTLPSPFELHLVYNGTRRFLGDWDRLEPASIARTIADTYQVDLLRANADHAHLAGLQLDLDVPTRLLPQYAQTLGELRKLIPPDSKLSITGLPTWAASDDIKALLEAVDFWIPQCYGASIPSRVSDRTPISSAAEVERTIARIRRLNKPFYAGLSAYSYAILYGNDGGLIELRGDIDPAMAAQSSGLELIDTGLFNGNAHSGETRYVYRAKADLVLDGLIIRPGETLVFDLPSAASLRASARAVRENAGGSLLGICIFRLPTSEDTTTLSPAEINAALSDTQTEPKTAISLNLSKDGRLNLSAENTGSATSTVGVDAMLIDIAIPIGAVSGASKLVGFSSFETLCGEPATLGLHTCSPMRANVIRLRSSNWKPGNNALSLLDIKQDLPESLDAEITVHIDDGRIVRQSLALPLNKVGY